MLSARPCENSLGALRRCSGRTDKYSIFNETTAFVVRLSRTMNAVFTQSGEAKNLPLAGREMDRNRRAVADFAGAERRD